MDDDDDVDDSEQTTALLQAAFAKNLQVLKRLKPDPVRDNVDKLLTKAATFGRVDSVRYLLELGAKPNDKPNGGSAALNGCLSTSLSCESFRCRISSPWYASSSKASINTVSKTLETFGLLLEHGALLRPEDKRELGSVRRSLYECEPNVTLKVVEGLVKRAACTPDTIHKLVNSSDEDTPHTGEGLQEVNIPRPGRGYWAMKAAGKLLPRQPELPKLSL